MEEIASSVRSLAVVILVNIALGVYHKIGHQHVAWSWKKFFQGILKAILISGAFLGLAYVFEGSDLSGTGITPKIIITAAIVLYAVKDCKNLAAVLGVSMENKS